MILVMPVMTKRMPQGYDTTLYFLSLKTANRTPSINNKVTAIERAKLVLSQVLKVKSNPGYSSSRHCDESLYANV